jgi:hypothetical protein
MEEQNHQWQACRCGFVVPFRTEEEAIIHAQRMGYGAYVQLVFREDSGEVTRRVTYRNESL